MARSRLLPVLCRPDAGRRVRSRCDAKPTVVMMSAVSVRDPVDLTERTTPGLGRPGLQPPRVRGGRYERVCAGGRRTCGGLASGTSARGNPGGVRMFVQVI